MLLVGGILDVVHDRINLHHLHVLKLRVEVLHLLTGVIDFVPLKLSRLQGLPGGHGLVKIRAGRINFLGKQERCMNTGAGQLTGIVIRRDVEAVLLSHHLNAALTVLNIHGPFDICTAIIFQPQINWNCHKNYSVMFSDAPSSGAGEASGRRQASACGTRLISTRRLRARPSAVSFGATGRLSPYPCTAKQL